MVIGWLPCPALGAILPFCLPGPIELKDAYWHVPINQRFRKFLAFAIGPQVYRFKVLPFGLGLAPRVFTKMMVPVRSRLISLGVNTLFYLDDWLIVGDSQEDCARMIDITLSVGKEMGLAFNIPKSHLCPSQSLTWLGLVWDTVSQTVALSVRNRARCWSKVFLAIHSRTLSRRRWESLIGSLNFAAVVVPLGRLRLRRLILEGRRVFNSVDRDRLVRFPQRLRNLLRWWLRASRLDSVTPWIPPPPSVTVVTDATDIGWGFQTSERHQESGLWTEEWRLQHINMRELQVVYIALSRIPSLAGRSIQVLSDNMAAVQCINRQGSTRCEALLVVSEALLGLADYQRSHIVATHLAGSENLWADALSRDDPSAVNWSLLETTFHDLSLRLGRPEIDLFASHLNRKTDLYLTRFESTVAGGPDAFAVDWNQWGHIYLFPPPLTSMMLRVVNRLRSYRGKVMLIAPLWIAQPWAASLLRWCPHPLPLGDHVLQGVHSSPFMKCLNLHAWSFSVNL